MYLIENRGKADLSPAPALEALERGAHAGSGMTRRGMRSQEGKL